VGSGLEVRVVDQKTGDDVTSLTLAQILLEGLRQRTARIPQPLLVQLVRLTAAPARRSATASGGSQRALDEAEKIVRDLLARGRLSLEEAVALRQEIVRSWSGLLSEAQAGLREFLDGVRGTPRKRTDKKRKKRKKTVARTASLSLARRPVRRAKERVKGRQA
jgi:polyhydroxyalkanoate synthesis regulator phasin